jgi:modulator of FtsH protease
MAGYEIERWSDFAVMLGGAFAALAGLLFVAVSINVREIVGTTGLPARALETLVLFTTPLVVAIFLLVPDQGHRTVGAELLGVAAVVGVVLARQNQRSRSDTHIPRGSRAFRVVVHGIVFAAVVAAGATLLAGTGGGLYWIVPATVAALAGGLTNAWVLLVEILR